MLRGDAVRPGELDVGAIGWRRMLMIIERLICVAGSVPMLAIFKRTEQIEFLPPAADENNGK
jgi:hypothetical protein